MFDRRTSALRENFDFFQEVVGSLMSEHAGQYALIHAKSIAGIFSRPIDALRAGNEKFDDGLFSIQKVTDRPLDLGFLSYGAGERAPL